MQAVPRADRARARDVTAEVNAGVKAGMTIADVQRVRQAARSDLERACQTEKGDRFSCAVVDFNSGARSLLITYEDFRDVRLVYAPEKQLGYFGGDEMNFRFPRYVSDISILRAYQGTDGSHGEYDASHVPVKPDHYLHVSMAGVKDGDFTLVAGNPGNTNRYRESYSAEYNLRKGIPDQIRRSRDAARTAAQVRGDEARISGGAAKPDLRPGQHAQVSTGRAGRAAGHRRRRRAPPARDANSWRFSTRIRI